MIKHLSTILVATLACAACSQATTVPSGEASEKAATPAAVEPSAPADVASLLPESERANYAKHALASPAFGPVLVSEYKYRDEDIGHVTAGRLDVAYLAGQGQTMAVKQRYPRAVEVGSSGSVAEWSVSDDYLANPVIVASGGFTGQGYTEGCTLLTELRPDGPHQVAAVPDFAGRVDGPETQGKIGAVQKGKSFVVNYTGEKPGSVTWTWQSDKFVPSGAAPIEACGGE